MSQDSEDSFSSHNDDSHSSFHNYIEQLPENVMGDIPQHTSSDEELSLYEPIEAERQGKISLQALIPILLQHAQSLHKIDENVTEIERKPTRLLKNQRAFVLDEIMSTHFHIYQIVSNWKDYFGESGDTGLSSSVRLNKIVRKKYLADELENTLVNLHILINESTDIIENEDLTEKQFLWKMIRTWNYFVESFEIVMDDDEKTESSPEI